MARMHSRRKGQAGSKRPMRTAPPEWMELSKDEIIAKIVELANEGKHAAIIGQILRDSYGVPDVKLATGKKIYEIIREQKLAKQVPDDLRFLITKALRLRKHLEENRKDLHNKRGMKLVEQKIHRLSKYYKRRGVLDPKWRYRPDTAAILLR